MPEIIYQSRVAKVLEQILAHLQNGNTEEESLLLELVKQLLEVNKNAPAGNKGHSGIKRIKPFYPTHTFIIAKAFSEERRKLHIEYFFRGKGVSDGETGSRKLWSAGQKKWVSLLPFP